MINKIFIVLIIKVGINFSVYSQDNYQFLQSKLDSIVKATQIPGLNFSLIENSGRQFNFSSGFENIEEGKKLGIYDLMLSGSIGKTYAAACIYQLIDEKKINLDDKINKHLNEFDWLEYLPNYDEITVEMLLSHTSGLPRWVLKPQVWQILRNEPNREWSYKDRLELIFNEKEVHESGKGWAYSDTNYLLLAMVLESIENKDYYKIIESRLLGPFSLNETSPSNQRKIKNLAMGYSDLPESFKIPNNVLDEEGSYVFNPQMEWSGGGMASTTSDLVKWCDLYYNSKVFGKDLKNKMVSINSNGKNVYQNKHSYGMGSFIYNTKHGIAYGHSGFMPGYNSIMLYYPDHKVSLALQINCDFAIQKMPLTSYLEHLMNFIL